MFHTYAFALLLIIGACSNSSSSADPFSHAIVGTWIESVSSKAYVFGADQRLSFNVTEGACVVAYSFVYAVSDTRLTISGRNATASDETVCETESQARWGTSWQNLASFYSVFSSDGSFDYTIAGSTLTIDASPSDFTFAKQ